MKSGQYMRPAAASELTRHRFWPQNIRIRCPLQHTRRATTRIPSVWDLCTCLVETGCTLYNARHGPTPPRGPFVITAVLTNNVHCVRSGRMDQSFIVCYGQLIPSTGDTNHAYMELIPEMRSLSQNSPRPTEGSVKRLTVLTATLN